MSIENDKIFRENVINKFNEMFKKKTSNNIEREFIILP